MRRWAIHGHSKDCEINDDVDDPCCLEPTLWEPEGEPTLAQVVQAVDNLKARGLKPTCLVLHVTDEGVDPAIPSQSFRVAEDGTRTQIGQSYVLLAFMPTGFDGSRFPDA